MTSVYLAGPYAARDRLAEYGEQLTRVGYILKARWLTRDAETQPEGAATEAPLDDRRRWASEDLEDITRADMLVAFTAAAVDLPPGFGTSGGRHVETGYALGIGRPVVLVGEPENVFHWLPRVTRVPDWHEALIELSAQLVASERGKPRAPRAVEASRD